MDYTVFHGGQLFGRWDRRPEVLPYRAWVRLEIEEATIQPIKRSIHWYKVIVANQLMPVNTCDIPNDVKTICLLMELPLTA